MDFNIGDILIGVGIGIAVAFNVMHSILKSVNKRLESELDKHIKQSGLVEGMNKTVVDATINHENGVYYMFNKDDQSFLAQGTTLNELHTHLEARFKDMVFRVDKIPDTLKEKSSLKSST